MISDSSIIYLFKLLPRENTRMAEILICGFKVGEAFVPIIDKLLAAYGSQKPECCERQSGTAHDGMLKCAGGKTRYDKHEYSADERRVKRGSRPTEDGLSVSNGNDVWIDFIWLHEPS